MEGLNPTAENMAKWLCDRIPHCIRVAVQETEGNTAVYENKFPVAEIFDSIEGEGNGQGIWRYLSGLPAAISAVHTVIRRML